MPEESNIGTTFYQRVCHTLKRWFASTSNATSSRASYETWKRQNTSSKKPKSTTTADSGEPGSGYVDQNGPQSP